MSDLINPSAGGRYERDSNGNLTQVEAPTVDATYDRGEQSAPVADPAAIIENFIPE